MLAEGESQVMPEKDALDYKFHLQGHPFSYGDAQRYRLFGGPASHCSVS